MTKVRYQLTREIPEWKAMLEGRPATAKEGVEVEVWEHQTRGLESLARAFATLKTDGGVAKIESGDVLFVRPPDTQMRKFFSCQPYSPMELSIGLPTLREGDDAQKVADEFFGAVRSIYREGCELAAKLVKTLLDLPEEAWDSPHEISFRYADAIPVRGFSAAAAINVACRKLGLPTDYLASLFCRDALKKHKKLHAHWEGIAERRLAEIEEAKKRVKVQHNEREAEIRNTFEANQAKVEEMFLGTCDEADRERYERGLFPNAEKYARLRELVFGHCDFCQYVHMSDDYVCECGDVKFYTLSADPRLTSKEFEALKGVEKFFQDNVYKLEIREHLGVCERHGQSVSEKAVLVTWQLPGAGFSLSREYRLGLEHRTNN